MPNCTLNDSLSLYFVLYQSTQARAANNITPPTTRRQAPPNMENLAGASRPNLMASAISTLGSENPSWAHRKGRISSAGNLLQILLLLSEEAV